MRYRLSILLLIMLMFLAGCQNTAQVCPSATGTPNYLAVPPDELATPATNRPGQVEIGWQTIQVDKIVEGPLCNDNWSGKVYVGCDVQVYPWVEHPTFLKDCELNIEPGTVIYVADHNDTAYYNGCSCHTGSTPEP